MATPRSLIELRVLDGPNRHLGGPAIQLRLDVRTLLDATREDMAVWLDAVELGDLAAQPGDPGSDDRRAAVTWWLRAVTRHLASLGGVDRLKVIVDRGHGPDEMVVAFPWSRETRATKLGEWVGWAIDDAGELALSETFAEAQDRLRNVSAGPRSPVVEPHVPVVGVTGTNGKTTTTRLLAHLLMAAGRTPAWNSTDGVSTMAEDRSGGVLVEQGDWAGFNGAARVLATPGIDVAVLEVARGGILRRGMGVSRLDAAVVTNVTEDHMGEMGIQTLDDLARVKGTVVRAVTAEGCAVLNAQDPRVAAMAGECAGRVCWTSLDPADLPDDGRAAVTVQGDTIVLRQDAADGGAVEPIAGVAEVPLTLGGLAVHNVANVLSAAGAGLAMGLDASQVADGLRSFAGDATANPGRLNVFAGPDASGRAGVRVIADIAHNVDSMAVLAGVARGLAARGEPAGRLLVVAGSLGDRTADIIMGIGMAAAEDADVLLLAEKRRYLRGSERTHVIALLQAGAAKAGWDGEVPVFADELAALDAALELAAPGDVVAIAVHEHQRTISEVLAERGFTPTTA